MNSCIEESIEQEIKKASRSKSSFIQFIKDIDIPQSSPWVVDWLDRFWTDEMSNVFFDTYWNGSLDVVTLYANYEELPSLLDDICRCMDNVGLLIS